MCRHTSGVVHKPFKLLKPSDEGFLTITTKLPDSFSETEDAFNQHGLTCGLLPRCKSKQYKNRNVTLFKFSLPSPHLPSGPKLDNDCTTTAT